MKKENIEKTSQTQTKTQSKAKQHRTNKHNATKEHQRATTNNDIKQLPDTRETNIKTTQKTKQK